MRFLLPFATFLFFFSHSSWAQPAEQYFACHYTKDETSSPNFLFQIDNQNRRATLAKWTPHPYNRNLPNLDQVCQESGMNCVFHEPKSCLVVEFVSDESGVPPIHRLDLSCSLWPTQRQKVPGTRSYYQIEGRSLMISLDLLNSSAEAIQGETSELRYPVHVNTPRLNYAADIKCREVQGAEYVVLSAVD